ncbi:hypothetical protein [Allonocardiopsis opalescens]|uniref:Uncharacterized protein n=1 Tax=Allonocardiopsis opalescens TaxID=1144618 RepID=A0A2T0PTB8_9ACTN|nr:hypothetical protein [Allonocardiopsis opalescens]PRX92038.1 hypothetical protein CLV72_112111 [Allonocardiopsis opalescens]
MPLPARTLAAAALAAAAGCGAPAESAAPSPSFSEIEVIVPTATIPAATPTDDDVSPRAFLICEGLRLADGYERMNTATDDAEAQALIWEVVTDALDEDAEPALHAIAVEHMGDADAAAAEMEEWCAENTEGMPGDPW